jgi:hypothetical protein
MDDGYSSSPGSILGGERDAVMWARPAQKSVAEKMLVVTFWTCS